MLARTPLPEIVRESDASRINVVSNHPEVRPWVLAEGDTYIDWAPFLAVPGNLVLMTADGRGGVAFHQHEPGVYEAHTQFLPDARGRFALDAVRSMITHMFVTTDCMELLTKCPAGNRPAEALARTVGGTLDFERSGAWRSPRGLVSVRYYALRYADWIKSADGLSQLGAWFHDRLEAENARLGHPDELHDDDPAHDRHVGAAVAMMLCGQHVKGVHLYNRWARFADYEPIEILSLAPLVVDIRTHVLRIRDNDFEVISCQPVQ